MVSALLLNLAEIILGPSVNYIPPKLAFPFSFLFFFLEDFFKGFLFI